MSNNPDTDNICKKRKTKEDNKTTNTKTCIPCDYVGETIFFLFKIGSAMLIPGVRLYLYKVACLERYDKIVCDNLHNYTVENQDVQYDAGNYIIYYKLLVNVPAILLGLFCGPWSDKVGRKIPVLLPCVGVLLGCVLLILSSIPDVPTLLFVLLGGLARGCFGSKTIITMALNSYISDQSSKADRTRRLGALLAMDYMGFFVGSLVTGAILEVSGFVTVFCVVAALNVLCFFIALIGMKKTLSKEEDSSMSDKNPFKCSNVTDSLHFVVRKRPGRKRCYLILLFITTFLNQILRRGEMDVLLLFVENRPLYWSDSLYAYLVSVHYVCMGLGVLVALPLTEHFLHCNDISILLIGCISTLCRKLMLTFSSATWMVFTATALGFAGGYLVAAAKSLISLTVSEDEIGKAFSLISCGETVFELVGTVVLTPIYQFTSPYFPGTVFAVDSAVFLVLLMVIIAFIGSGMRKELNYKLLDGEIVEENYGTITPDPNAFLEHFK